MKFTNLIVLTALLAAFTNANATYQQIELENDDETELKARGSSYSYKSYGSNYSYRYSNRYYNSSRN